MRNRVELDLLAILLKEKRITAKSLSARLNVSNRTIRSYLGDARETLHRFDLELISKCGNGYWIEGSLQARLDLQNYLEEQKSIPHRTSSMERICYVLYALLMNHHKIHLTRLSESLYISRSALYGDLKKAEEITQKYHLKIDRRRGQGIILLGNEKDKRKLLFWLVKKIHNENYLYYQNEQLRSYAENCFDDNFTNKKIVRLLRKFEEKNHLCLGRNDFEYLRLMIYLSIDRIHHGFGISGSKNQEERIPTFLFMCDTGHLQDELQSIFHLNISKYEIRYLSSFFLSLRHTTILREDAISKQKAQKIVDRFALLMYQQIDVKRKEEFEKGLRYHLMAILSKTNYDYDYSNPITQKIKEEYAVAYLLAKEIVPIVHEEAHIDFPDDEVAYIAVHIAAAIEQSIEPIKVLFLYEHRYSELKFALSLIQAHIKEIEIVGVLRYQDYRSLIEEPQHAVIFASFSMQSDLERVYQIPMLPDKTFINDLREIMRKYFVSQHMHL